MAKEKQVWTALDVAEYLDIRDCYGNLNPRAVTLAAWKGKIPAKKVCGKWRFFADDIRKWISRGEIIMRVDPITRKVEQGYWEDFHIV